MIHAVIIFNEGAKPRLLRFYDGTPLTNQLKLVGLIHSQLSQRQAADCCFISWPPAELATPAVPAGSLKVVYRHFATLYFCMIIDETESELAILDLIQVLVQVLDTCFENVCELDIIYHFDRCHYILDELIIGGLVLESNFDSIIGSIRETSSIK